MRYSTKRYLSQCFFAALSLIAASAFWQPNISQIKASFSSKTVPIVLQVSSAKDVSDEFVPVTFGMNITESLLNTAEPNVTMDRLQRQIALILYDLRLMGGQTARWMVSDVWPQWRCNQDPEDQQTGTLDEHWFVVARSLLEEAARQNVKIVVVLSDPTGALFGDAGPSGKSQAERWVRHRRELIGIDGYDHSINPDCETRAGYYGAYGDDALFDNSLIEDHLAQRFIKMADFLVQFPALGALELFNEPDFRIARTEAYWMAVNRYKRQIQAKIKAHRTVPILSGTATWDQQIASAASRTGSFDLEPFITVHAYDDYSQDENKIQRDLQEMVSYIRKLAPSKAIVIAEAGSKISLFEPADHQKMVRILVNLQKSSNVGVWVWGNWFSLTENDFKWTFNHRSLVGGSFRAFDFDSEREEFYFVPRQLVARGAADSQISFQIQQVGSAEKNVHIRGSWAILVNGTPMYGFSRGGVFSRSQFTRNNQLSQSTFYISGTGQSLIWAEVKRVQQRWSLVVNECQATTGKGQLTPILLQALAADVGRSEFLECRISSVKYTAEL